MGPEERFDDLAATFAGTPGVTLPDAPGARGFGSTALRDHGSIFAMLTRGRLVVKLPAERVAALIAQGEGGPFDANRGRPMREWLTVGGGDPVTWLALSKEALAFVGSTGPG